MCVSASLGEKKMIIVYVVKISMIEKTEGYVFKGRIFVTWLPQWPLMFYVADPSLIKGLNQFLKIINMCFAWVKSNWLIDFNYILFFLNIFIEV